MNLATTKPCEYYHNENNMKAFYLKWRGTIIVYKVVAENLTKAKIKFCNFMNVNALMTADRIERKIKHNGVYELIK